MHRAPTLDSRFLCTQGNAELQGNVSLMDCTITKEDFSFSVRAPHMKVYSFLVQTKQDVEQWVAALVAAIKQARELEETAATKPNNVDIVNSVRHPRHTYTHTRYRESCAICSTPHV